MFTVLPLQAYLHDSPHNDHGYSSHGKSVPNFYRNADVVILVFSVDDSHTLEALQDCWIADFAVYADVADASWVIVGNKNDRPLDFEQHYLDNLAQRLGKDTVSMFASAKTGNNVELLFEVAIKKGYERRKRKEVTINLKEEKKPHNRSETRQTSSGCCK